MMREMSRHHDTLVVSSQARPARLACEGGKEGSVRVIDNVVRVAVVSLVAACTPSNTATRATAPAGPISPGAGFAVAPTIATLRVGDTLRFVATVEVGSAGVAWTTQDPSKVGVDATGLASGLAATTSSVAVCATSKSDAGKKGCAGVTVAAP